MCTKVISGSNYKMSLTNNVLTDAGKAIYSTARNDLQDADASELC
jgi:hypothetical protein